MRVLVTGSTGQLGSEIIKLWDDTLGTDRKSFDMEEPGLIREELERIKPNLIINCAAMTDVDACQKNMEKAYTINYASPLIMARYCIKNNIKMVHFSTDYVFDGEKGNYREEAIPDPINYYGLSKLLGDSAVECVPNHVIIRTSGVYGTKQNFPLVVYNMLKSGKEVKTIDSFYSPIHAKNLARASTEIVKNNFTGIVNVAGERVSRLGFALKIAEYFKLDSSKIIKVESFMNQIAKRPRDSSLSIDAAKSIVKWDFFSLNSNLSQINTKAF
jgi:dTDP-4-dehydrorhamnose reductase